VPDHMPERFELVRWQDVAEGDHVWSMGQVCVITKEAFRNDDAYDRGLNPGIMRFGHRDESGSEFAPPMELSRWVPRLIQPAGTDGRTRPGGLIGEVKALAELAGVDSTRTNLTDILADVRRHLEKQARPVHVTFVWDEGDDYAYIEHDGVRVWEESSFGSVSQYLRSKDAPKGPVSIGYRVHTVAMDEQVPGTEEK
jgi:hypothetical protein